jgi:hypothetical protein
MADISSISLRLITFHLAAIRERQAENIFIVSASHISGRGTSTGLNVSFHSDPLDPYRDPLRYVHVTRGALFIFLAVSFYLSISTFGSLARQTSRNNSNNFVRNFKKISIELPFGR